MPFWSPLLRQDREACAEVIMPMLWDLPEYIGIRSGLDPAGLWASAAENPVYHGKPRDDGDFSAIAEGLR